MAWVSPVATLLGGSAGGITLDKEELRACAGSFSWQSASFPGSPCDVQSAVLRRVISRGFPRGFARTRGIDNLGGDGASLRGGLGQKLRELLRPLQIPPPA